MSMCEQSEWHYPGLGPEGMTVVRDDDPGILAYTAFHGAASAPGERIASLWGVKGEQNTNLHLAELTAIPGGVGKCAVGAVLHRCIALEAPKQPIKPPIVSSYDKTPERPEVEIRRTATDRLPQDIRRWLLGRGTFTLAARSGDAIVFKIPSYTLSRNLERELPGLAHSQLL